MSNVIYNSRYDTNFDAETGEWLDKIGFCPIEDECSYCKAYDDDGRPATGFDSDKSYWN
tara:strand:- start:741 stop:917 length:177 start_codon:yes stop_codon:yes gene_type:complete